MDGHTDVLVLDIELVRNCFFLFETILHNPICTWSKLISNFSLSKFSFQTLTRKRCFGGLGVHMKPPKFLLICQLWHDYGASPQICDLTSENPNFKIFD